MTPRSGGLRLRLLAGLLALIVVAVVTRALAGTGDGSRAASGGRSGGRTIEAPAIPATAPALRVLAPPKRTAARDETRWAPVLRATAARRAPAADARVVTRLSTRTPEGTANLVVATARRAGAGGQLWVKVALAILPNGSTGWVPRASLGGYTVVDTKLEISRSGLRATLLRAGRPVFHARVGIGAGATPTPAGRFYVRNRLDGFKDPFYGPVAFGLSGRSETLTDWPGGGFVGIHGTNQPGVLPGRVSHGCVRMRNADILRLARLMPIGTPVVIS